MKINKNDKIKAVMSALPLSFILVARVLTAAGVENMILHCLLSALLFTCLIVFVRLNKQGGRCLVLLLISAAGTYALKIYVSSDNRIIWALAFLCVCFMQRHSEDRNETSERYDQAENFSLILGMVFALFVFLGFQMDQSGEVRFLHLSHEEGGNIQFAAYFLIFAGWIADISCILRAIFVRCIAFNSQTERIVKRTLPDAVLFAVCVVVQLISWIPYYRAYYPGLIFGDILSEINQQMGFTQITDHHPIIHQLYLMMFVKIGTALPGGSVSLGFGICTAFQMILLSSACTAGIVYLRNHGASGTACCIVLAFSALSPINAYYSITPWKNTLSAACSMLMVVFLLKVLKIKYDEVFSIKKRLPLYIACIVTAVLFCTVMHNGLYAFIIGFLIIIVGCKEKEIRKRIAVILTAVLLAVGIYRAVVSISPEIKKGETREALSVPSQQIARVIRDKGTGITEDAESIKILAGLFPDIEALGGEYNPCISDPVKNQIIEEKLRETPLQYAKAWIRLGFNHPLTYIEAFLAGNYGYWYPDAKYWIINPSYDSNGYGIAFSDNTAGLRHRLEELFYEYADKQPTSILFSAGFVIWISLTIFTTLLLCGKKTYAFAMAPLLVLWLTALASPVFCEYRYIYPVAFTIPFFTGTVMCNPDNDEHLIISRTVK